MFIIHKSLTGGWRLVYDGRSFLYVIICLPAAGQGYVFMTVSIEYLQDRILRQWAENLWLLNNPNRNPNAAHYDRLEALNVKISASLSDNEPRGMKALSERSFTALCWGMAGVSTVSPKATDALSKSKLVDAWRTSVFRNRFQPRYDIFDGLLKQTADRFGVDAAIAQYPADSRVAPAAVADVFERMNYTSANFAKGEVAAMIRKAGAPPATPATKPAPKA